MPSDLITKLVPVDLEDDLELLTQGAIRELDQQGYRLVSITYVPPRPRPRHLGRLVAIFLVPALVFLTVGGAIAIFTQGPNTSSQAQHASPSVWQQLPIFIAPFAGLLTLVFVFWRRGAKRWFPSIFQGHLLIVAERREP